jgi:23S rRNA pseudouridine1911/1915/1917 synthase
VVKRPSYLLRGGERIKVRLPEIRKGPVQPLPIKIDVIYSDRHIIVISKPSGMLSQPSDYERQNTVVNAVMHRFGKLPYLENPDAQGLVHRLDRNVSGIMVLGKTKEALFDLYNQFKKRLVQKEYLAVVEGVIKKDKIIINKPLELYKKIWKARVSKRGKKAITEIHVIKRLDGLTFVKVVPLTGRTHQIRVHLASIDHPVLCDANYGYRKVYEKRGVKLTRPALHAYKLRFKHPHTKQVMEFIAPLAPDVSKLVS